MYHEKMVYKFCLFYRVKNIFMGFAQLFLKVDF